jgi:DNA transformation protein and related proteins
MWLPLLEGEASEPAHDEHHLVLRSVISRVDVMTASDGFVEFLKDLLGPLGPITVRRMFGGAGIFRDGVMFALIVDDTLYFKADDSNRRDFEAEGLAPFSYETKNGRNTIMSYWRCPDRLFDDPDEMAAWAGKALTAARTAAAKPAAGKRTRIKT